ncbi:MAG: formate--tetrahydrofolate ligase [Candidatus Thermoplasmatota archaeon]|nr:formate--tetrahydrofolate ligase [Candidatus Thermoplasmatota archaeon]
MDSDLEIARQAELLPIREVAESIGLDRDDLRLHGPHIAKVNWTRLKESRGSGKGKLILVTSVNPTPFGEGKTVTTIGLNQGLNRSGKKSCCVIREPSMGPVFGIKGGAAGGGYSQVLPMEDINLHFTGDLHAVSMAHNLLSAMLDNHLNKGNVLNIDTDSVFWPRVMDMNDRSLRSITIGQGAKVNGPIRKERFDITAASEVMAILALSKDYRDLRERLGRVVVASDMDGAPVTADQLNAGGAMALLLRDAFLPNLVQTLEGDPAFIHCGPFANIAHGNSSVVADSIALSTCDYVVTEAGFGADMGAEKALQIKSDSSGVIPDCIVLNVTVRSMKLHGGAFGDKGSRRPTSEELATENVEATLIGASTNMARHLANLTRTGIPVVVSINRFSTDTDRELSSIKDIALANGAREVVLFEGHGKGGEGAVELARSVLESVEGHVSAGRPYNPLVPRDASILEKISTIGTGLYGADSVKFPEDVLMAVERIESWGYGGLPVCMAKTQYSFSHRADLLGAPTGYELPIREVRLNAGAGFVVVICGSMMTMPGLPKVPGAAGMDIDEEGQLFGVFG